VDRELTRAELDELLPLYAVDALEGEEHEQVARYLARDADARAEVDSLREAASFLPPRDTRAPESLWRGIEGSLGASSSLAPPPPRLVPVQDPVVPLAGARRGRRIVGLLAAAAVVLAVVLGVQVVRQQHRIDELAAEMHRDSLEQQAMAARASSDAHVIPLASMHDRGRGGESGGESGGEGGAEVVMLPDGTGYLMGKQLPALDVGSTYQLWAEVDTATGGRMVSLGILGRDPRISAFRLAVAPTKFEVTREPTSGSDVPGGEVVLRGDVT
jgi:hypothetical protein